MNDHLLTCRELVARFRAIRKAKKLSVQNVADTTGIPQPVLSNLENGRRAMLTIDEARVIADALGVSLLDCLHRDPVMIVPAVTA